MGNSDWREAAAKKGVMNACFPACVGPSFAVGEYRAVQAEFQYAGGHVLLARFEAGSLGS